MGDYDRVYFERYVPGSSPDPVEPQWDKFSRAALNTSVIDTIAVYGEAAFAVDEIRVGTTWDSVTSDSAGGSPVCGNGVLETGEQCDDGNTASGDCCSPSCAFEPAGSSCSDGDVCNGAESCDGAGVCRAGTPLSCADGDPCTRGLCDPASGCSNPTGPATACVEAWGGGALLVRESAPGHERLIVRMSRGPALAQSQLGNPLAPGGTGYTLCLFDDADALAARLTVDRAGQDCGTAPCWRPAGAPPPEGRGFRYRDRSASASGVFRLLLKGGAAGRSSVLLKARNDAGRGQTSLPSGIAAALAGSAGATAQLVADDGSACLSLGLGRVSASSPILFKAKP